MAPMSTIMYERQDFNMYAKAVQLRLQISKPTHKKESASKLMKKIIY